MRSIWAQDDKITRRRLHFGEGLASCLKESGRELDVAIKVGDIFYVNPFLQISAFDKEDEVMAHCFWVQPCSSHVPFTSKPFDFDSEMTSRYFMDPH